MHRYAKLGLYTAVLAGLVAATFTWVRVDKTITLKVNGQTRTIHTVADSVSGVLKDAGYSVDSHDLIAPTLDSTVSNGQTVIFKQGRLLRLNIDGDRRDVWVTASTVSDALAELGYNDHSFTSVSRDKRLPLTPTSINLRTPKTVTLVVHGESSTVTTTEPTVAGLLVDQNISVGSDVKVSVPLASTPEQGQQVLVQQITTSTMQTQQPVPFQTTQTQDASRTNGSTKIVTKGQNGVATVTWSVVYLDGQLAGQTQQSSTVTQAPVNQVEVVGTKGAAATKAATDPAAAAAAAAAMAETAQQNAATAATTATGSPQAIAQQILASRGMGDDQFGCLVKLWDRESGWRTNAANSSGAYGIPQALPGSKMAAYGADWRTNPAVQIQWGLSYITGRYSTPCGAWGHSQATGWY